MTDEDKLSASFNIDTRDPDKLVEILKENPRAVTLGDVFDSEFMEENTEYSSLEAFVNDFPEDIEFGVEFDQIPVMASISTDEASEKQSLDNYIANATEFDDWEDMHAQGKSRMVALWTMGDLEVRV
jgi:hypothetical protein